MNPYLTMIFPMGANFAPVGFALCEGQLLTISSNTAVFSLLGTSFGGNGTTNFALPDLRGRTAIGWGSGLGLATYTIGQAAGVETVTLALSQIPAHNHTIAANSQAANTVSPAGAYFSGAPDTGSGPNASQLPIYTSNAPDGTQFNANTISNAGGSLAHENRQPYLAVTYVIALQGIFPTRN